MEKKRSRGITVLVVLYSITWVMFFSTNKTFDYGDYRDITVIHTYLAILILPFLAFGIFNLKKLFRKIAIAYEIFNVVVVCALLTAGFLDTNDYGVNKYSLLVLMIIFQICVPLAIIYFLTRPKVKEQFK